MPVRKCKPVGPPHAGSQVYSLLKLYQDSLEGGTCVIGISRNEA